LELGKRSATDRKSKTNVGEDGSRLNEKRVVNKDRSERGLDLSGRGSTILVKCSKRKDDLLGDFKKAWNRCRVELEKRTLPARTQTTCVRGKKKEKRLTNQGTRKTKEGVVGGGVVGGFRTAT